MGIEIRQTSVNDCSVLATIRRLAGGSASSKDDRELGSLSPLRRPALFVAEEKGSPLAAVVAHLSALDLATGQLGWFEALDRRDAVQRLMDEACRYLASYDCRRVVGPINGDTWHRYRVNVGPFDSPPFLLETWNPPFHGELWSGSGFAALEHYSSKRIPDIEPLLAHLRGKWESSISAGYRFVPLRLDDFRNELKRVFSISLQIFEENFMYSPIALDDFLALYDGAERLLERDSAWFAIAPDGSDAGFIFTYPDRFEAVQRMQSGGVLNKIRGLLKWNHIPAVNYKTLGVVPEHRRSGTGGALLYCAYDAALKHGWRVANHCLMRDDNPSQKMDAGEGTTFRRYVLYAKELA